MARKKDDGFGLALFGGLGFILLGVFLINSICVFRHYNKKYDFREATARITDTWNFTRFTVPIIGFGGIAYLCLLPVIINIFNPPEHLELHRHLLGILVLLAINTPLVFLPFLLISARIGTTQAGFLIYAQRGYFVMPTDWNKNTFIENIFQLKIITAMYTMECLRLKDVTRITRDGGKIALIHGNFGTRKMAWRTKQKRDECIAALENACGRRLGSYM